MDRKNLSLLFLTFFVIYVTNYRRRCQRRIKNRNNRCIFNIGFPFSFFYKGSNNLDFLKIKIIHFICNGKFPCLPGWLILNCPQRWKGMKEKMSPFQVGIVGSGFFSEEANCFQTKRLTSSTTFIKLLLEVNTYQSYWSLVVILNYNWGLNAIIVCIFLFFSVVTFFSLVLFFVLLSLYFIFFI